MKQKKQITNRTFVLTAVIGSLLIMAMMAANSLWNSKKIGNVTDEAVSAVSSFYLEAMADRRAKTVTNLISNSFDQMEKAVSFIAGENIGSQEELRNIIGELKYLLGLNRFALVDEDDVVYTQYTTYTGGSRHPFLYDEHLSDRIISIVSLYGSSKQLCLAIPTPELSIMGKQFKACFIQMDIDDIVNLLAFEDEGRTYFALYSKSGGNLSGTELGPVISRKNLLEALSGIVSEDVRNEHIANFENETEGSLSFGSGSRHETLCYVPIKDAGWQMAVLIKESVIQDQIRDISEKNLETSRDQIFFTLVAVLILAAVLLFQLRRLAKAKLEAEQETSRNFQNMANTDSLTGIRNKHAYSEMEAALDAQIQAGGLEKLAVVVCDINGLKHVNDTQGHAAGDKLITDACALICEYFTHGAVFRIGGDEFAILLQDKGYDTMEEVLAELNARIENNIKENGVVISIGCDVLKHEDHTVRDVFERADKKMYDRKKQLKAMGAATRL